MSVVNYSVSLSRQARRGLRGLSDIDYERVTRALRALVENPRPPGCQRLTDQPGWRIRIGDIRIIYEIDDTRFRIEIIDIGHRSTIYRLRRNGR